MSDGAISQDEIDALLSGVDMGGLSSGETSSSKEAESSLNTAALTEFVNNTGKTLETSLETMTGAKAEVGSPVMEVLNRDQILRKIPEMVVAVMSDFSEGLTGDHLFLLAPEFAQKLAGLINKEEAPELDDMTMSVISEIVSQHTGTEITNLSNTHKINGLACNPPEAMHVPKAMVRFPQNFFLLITFPVTVDGSAFSLWEIAAHDVAAGMIRAFGGDAPADASPSANGFPAADMQQMAGMGAAVQPGMAMNAGNFQMQGGMGTPMNMGNFGMMNGGMPQNQMPGAVNMGMNVPNVQAIQYPNLQPVAGAAEQGNIGLIMDVFMEMTVELGHTKKRIKEILGMGEGTIIELDKLAGEPVDILVNHKPIARGEVVVIDENFGVRVTEILSPMERVSDLG
ncbi:MAG: flagellar motor switch protein FliN [Bacteroides sp.]|nr:flagellar motor switch protein FliN [Prevotella sp.]MCM1407336.1 flagellar motor switch protein FliN [Treponema brennaborense]MCM1469826.1 flagellar motor switch protein FliN [Bacteroides sp.]